jgi:tetratricopeptide (TPR) repeat protein
VALAAPAGDPRDKYKVAAQLDENGDGEKAIAVIDEGLALAPRDLALLGLKGIVLLKLRDYSGALAAYQAYLDAGATGANRREAQKIVRDLSAVRSTFLDIALAISGTTLTITAVTQTGDEDTLFIRIP